MRSRQVTALSALSALASLPEQPGRPFGKEAEKLTEAEVLRLEKRVYRASNSRGVSLPPALLVSRSAKRRRAAQTHPGKRR